MADIRRVNKLSHNLLLSTTVHVLGHQLVHAVVDVRGVDELQAAVVLALGGDVDHGVDEVVLLEELGVVVPLELWLGVAGHSEGDAPVVVEHGLQELQDGWRDYGEEGGHWEEEQEEEDRVATGERQQEGQHQESKNASIHRFERGAEGWWGRVTQHWRRRRWRNVAPSERGRRGVPPGASQEEELYGKETWRVNKICQETVMKTERGAARALPLEITASRTKAF